MTPVAVRKTAEQLDLFRQLLACELIVSTQALELRRPPRVAPVAKALFDTVRGAVAATAEDRSTTEDIEVVTNLIRGGICSAAVRAALAG